MKYEKSLKEKGFHVPSRDKGGEGKENAAETVKEASSLVMQSTTAETTEIKVAQQPASPTFHLNLNQQRETRRTEEDFRLPKSSSRKAEECKQQ